jgi:D-alanyl-D-alanine carboxypeptidase/D-alanyl-D-alanine-endopeptidase (penicillin-binding protein 4)
VIGGNIAIRRIVAVILITAAAGCGYLALRDDDAPAATTDAPRLATPLWSPRRVPQPLVDAVGAQRLQSGLDAELAANQNCVIVTDGAGELASKSPNTVLAPASTEKLLTTAVALSTMGPDFRYETKAVASAAPANGAVPRLWLVGAGDPGLATPEYQTLIASDPKTKDEVTTSLVSLADSIVAAGVRSIPGGVQGDDSRYDTTRYLPTWKDTYRTDGQVGPIGALTVNHGFSAFRPKPVPVDDPAVFAAGELTRLLTDRGVAVGGAPGHSNAPGDAVSVASVQSPPFRDVVESLIRISDNLGAELLTRELGARVANQGTTAAGIQVIADKARGLGIPVEGLTLVDGSGLDRGNRVSCRTLVTALALGARPELRALWDGLAVAGQSGTLEDEFRGSPLTGKLRGKTGSLQGVTGLAALIDQGRAVSFAFLANGDFAESGGIAIRARVADIVGRFPDAPAADQLVPMPNTPTPAASP